MIPLKSIFTRSYLLMTFILLFIISFDLVAQFAAPKTIYEYGSPRPNHNRCITHPIDVNNDDYIDIYIPSLDEWFRNEGNSEFTRLSNITDFQEVLNLSVIYIKVADINSDGWEDIILQDTKGRIAWYENDTNGKFINETIVFPEGTLESLALVEDIDGDNDIDIVVAKTSFFDDYDRNYTIKWVKNQESGLFSEPITILDTDNGTESGLCSDNLDRIDILHINLGIANQNGEKELFLTLPIDNATNGNRRIVSFSAENPSIKTFYDIGLPFFTYQIRTADLNGDFKTDIIARDLGSDRILWYESKDSGISYESKVITYLLGDGFSSLGSLDYSDIDSDGDIDIVLTMQDCYSQSELFYFENRDSSFARFSLSNIEYSPSHAFLEDFDNDGDKDILLSQFDNAVKLYENISVPPYDYDCQTDTTRLDSVACGSFDWYDINIEQSGEYKTSLRTDENCDSTIILNVELFEDAIIDIVEPTCNENLIGKVYTIYDGKRNNSKCDSLVTLSLIQGTTDSGEILVETMCSGDTVVVEDIGEDKIYTKPGIYRDTLERQGECSLITAVAVVQIEVEPIKLKDDTLFVSQLVDKAEIDPLLNDSIPNDSRWEILPQNSSKGSAQRVGDNIEYIPEEDSLGIDIIHYRVYANSCINRYAEASVMVKISSGSAEELQKILSNTIIIGQGDNGKFDPAEELSRKCGINAVVQELRILNPQGAIIFQGNEAWDGRTQITRKTVPEGVYFYELSLEIGGEMKPVGGYIMVLN